MCLGPEKVSFLVCRFEPEGRGNLKNKSTRLLQDFVLRNDTPCSRFIGTRRPAPRKDTWCDFFRDLCVEIK